MFYVKHTGPAVPDKRVITLCVQNPNYVGAFLHNATLHLYRVGHDALPAQHTIKTVGKPFGIARVGESM